MYFANKKTVRDSFQKNFDTYNKQATVQKDIASALVCFLSNLFGTSFNKVLEVGCGTGFLTSEILKNFAINEYLLNDLTLDQHDSVLSLIQEYSSTQFSQLAGDAETINFPENLDAVFSTSTFQWFHNLDTFFHKVANNLKPDGLFAFSTFGKNNFTEIKELLNVGLDYKSISEIKKSLQNNFEIIHSTEWLNLVNFKNPKRVLKHVKRTGVNAIQHCYFGKEKYLKFCDDYEKQFSNDDGTVNLTYHPIIIIARKKDS